MGILTLGGTFDKMPAQRPEPLRSDRPLCRLSLPVQGGWRNLPASTAAVNYRTRHHSYTRQGKRTRISASSRRGRHDVVHILSSPPIGV